MAKMNNHETKTVKVTPKRGNTIPDILTQNRMITGETTMAMNVREIRRAMSFGEVAEVSGSTEIPLNTRNYNDAPTPASTPEASGESDPETPPAEESDVPPVEEET